MAGCLITPPVAVIVTVLNETQTIDALLVSLRNQVLQPTEIIIVDGGSIDETWKKLRAAQQRLPQLKIFKRPGNRSVGRNWAIAKAQSSLIAITDAGCMPQPTWLAELVTAWRQQVVSSVQQHRTQIVVAGYYQGLADSRFKRAVIPFALVMPDRVKPESFLPATRSMLLPKAVWTKVGGFPEQLADNEDFVFAWQLRRHQVPVVFAREAIVNWQPPATLQQFTWMIYRFARGDAQVGLRTIKVLTVFARYVVMLMVSVGYWPAGLLLVVSYLVWAVIKNARYVGWGLIWLPLLQLTADLAVMAGTLAGWSRRMLVDQSKKDASI